MNSYPKICLIFSFAIWSFSFVNRACAQATYLYESPELVVNEAKTISGNLEAYIKKWLAGEASAAVPADLIPSGVLDLKNFYLKHSEEVTAAETWAIRYAAPVNFDSVFSGVPEPHCTYLFLGTALAPFGSKLVIEGDFPHARFFSIQITPPLNGKEYYAQRVFGTAEVSLVDADIDPLPGNINPFRVGADRNATNRKYHVEFDLASGDPVSLNDGAHTPLYRKKGNHRVGALLTYQGPLGTKNLFDFPINGGKWNVGAVWARIYAPDLGSDKLGGVALPKVWYELPSGEKYFVGSDFSQLVINSNTPAKARVSEEANSPNFGPTVGWFKSWGIVRGIFNGIWQANGWDRKKQAPETARIDLENTGRGEFQPAPGNYEAHATTNNYSTYLGRGLGLSKGNVVVLTGKMPVFPETRAGQPTMQAGECRFWSIGGYDNSPFSSLPGSAISTVMDDEVKLDANRNYVIVYSRVEDRPLNLQNNPYVTWVNWGPTGYQNLMMRWVTVSGDWESDRSPQENHLKWAPTDWASLTYDSTLIGLNSHKGFMGCFLPRVHLMSKQEFEALGTETQADNIPIWIDGENRAGISDARFMSASASSFVAPESISGASAAFDGDLNTSWRSAWGYQPQWLQVDLGSSKIISGIKLFWDFWQNALTYQIQTSADGFEWTTLYENKNGQGGIELAKNLFGEGRFVRLTMNGSLFGSYSVKEFEVFTPQLAGCNEPPLQTQLSKFLKLASVSTATISDTQVLVYPNPGTGELINYQLPKQVTPSTLSISVYTIGGKELVRLKLESLKGTFSMSSLPSGWYTLVFRSANWKASKAYLKQ